MKIAKSDGTIKKTFFPRLRRRLLTTGKCAPVPESQVCAQTHHTEGHPTLHVVAETTDLIVFLRLGCYYFQVVRLVELIILSLFQIASCHNSNHLLRLCVKFTSQNTYSIGSANMRKTHYCGIIIHTSPKAEKIPFLSVCHPPPPHTHFPPSPCSFHTLTHFSRQTTNIRTRTTMSCTTSTCQTNDLGRTFIFIFLFLDKPRPVAA